MSRNGSIISLEGVRKVYDSGKIKVEALRGIDLEVRRGEFMTLAGPSGSGKSTLMNILGCLDVPSEGTYHFESERVDRLSLNRLAEIRNRSIGFVFQNFNLIGDLTVIENVALPLRYRRVGGSQVRKLACEALEKVGMSHRTKHYPAQLSGGQQQRVAVARAIVGNPTVILADEPTGNLDSQNSLAVMEILKDLHRNGSTICMVTHDPRYVGYADVRFELLDGRLGSTDQA